VEGFAAGRGGSGRGSRRRDVGERWAGRDGGKRERERRAVGGSRVLKKGVGGIAE